MPSACSPALRTLRDAGVLALCYALAPLTLAVDSVALQLKWSHGFQFAGYYAAKEKGYYGDAGLAVDIRAAAPGSDPVASVVAGQAEYGVGNSSLLLARQAGLPVVALAVIFQHSPLLLIARQERPAQGVHDLVGKRFLLEPQSDELLAYLKREGIPLERITRVEQGNGPQDLIDGKVDVISAYETQEPYDLARAGFVFHRYTPRSAGIDFYGDNLFTSEHELKRQPARVAAFREASLRGWQYAMDHPEEIVELILAHYPSPHGRDFLRHEARKMVPLLQTELVEVGYMSAGRWRHIADTYADLGLLPRDFSLAGFLYDANPRLDLSWLYLAGALLGALSLVALAIYRNNRRLAGMIGELERAKSRLSDSETQFRVFTETAASGIFVLEGLRFVMVNPALLAISGYSEQEIRSLEIADLASPEQRGLVLQRFAALPEATTLRLEFLLLNKQGLTRWVELSASALVLHGQPSAAGTLTDISERRAIAEALRVSEAHHRLLADNASDVIWTMDLQGRTTYISPSVEKLRGYFVDEVLAQSIEQLMTPASAALARQEVGRILAAIEARQPVPDFRGELEQRCKDGSTVWTEVSISAMCNPAGEYIGLLGITRDIRERKATEQRLRQMAQYDLLTGLPNRALFSDRLQQAFADGRRSGKRLALMFLDLDKFKPINDTLGHAVGDLLLKDVASRMHDCVRESDTVARIGGDEFVVLLRSVDHEKSALLVAEKLRHALAQPFPVAGQWLSISASIGVALCPDHGSDEIELSRNADLAMYEAKKDGRDTVRMARVE